MYVRINECVYVCMYACMYVHMYVCMHACMYVHMYVCMYACMVNVRTYKCKFTNEWMYVSTHIWCKYVCMYVYVCMYAS